MAWRTIVISKPARLRIENDQLTIMQEEAVSLPLEDIAVLVLESPEVALSAALLNRLAELDVMLLVCDARHLPSMAGVPFAGHSRLVGVQRLQLGTSLPFRKRCWQAIVKQKIANQAACLDYVERTGGDRLREMADAVQSGDTGNVESSAAKEYFRRVFGDGFARGADDPRNSALNYGYAVVRAAVARALSFHGFLPAHGIHHRSELNQFNLADDFIEPLRPVVDLCAAGMELGAELTKEDRQRLVSLLHVDVAVDGNNQQLLRAAEIMTGSFLAACRAGDPRLLKLPSLLPLQMHEYE